MVFYEILLGFVLFVSSVVIDKYSPSTEVPVRVLMTFGELCFIWVVPAVAVWVVARELEEKLYT